MLKLCVHGGSTVTAYTVPELLCGGYARLEKETTIRGHKSRYHWFKVFDNLWTVNNHIQHNYVHKSGYLNPA